MAKMRVFREGCIKPGECLSTIDDISPFIGMVISLDSWWGQVIRLYYHDLAGCWVAEVREIDTATAFEACGGKWKF